MNGSKRIYTDALMIIVYTKDEWPNIHERDGTKPTVVLQNENYVISYASGQDLGGNPDLEAATKDINKILSTFKFTN